MNTIKQLERSAIRAHARGVGWNDFWQEHGAKVCRAEPHDRQRFGRLVRRLLALLTSGNLDGMEPAGDAMPWEVNNERDKPADVGTAARIDWTGIGHMEPSQ